MSRSAPNPSRRAVLAGLLSALALPVRSWATEPAELKAVFLVRFLRYVEFGAPTPSAIQIHVVGADDVATALEVVRDKLGTEQTMAVTAVAWEALGDLAETPCHVLYLRGSLEQVAEAVARANPGTLVVGDAEELLGAGAALAFFWEKDRLRFAASQPNAEARGVRLGAELLRLSRGTRP